MEDLSERIRQAIADKGLKNCGLGKLVSISVPTIDRIVSGETVNPGILTVMEIAHALGRTVSQLIGEVNPPAEIPRGLCTWDDLRECLESLGVSEVEAFVSIAETSVGGSKGLGKKRQLGQGGKS